MSKHIIEKLDIMKVFCHCSYYYNIIIIPYDNIEIQNIYTHNILETKK